MMVSPFDPVATAFNQYRELPEGVAETVRKAIRESGAVSASARILDLGAGTGRFGKVFVSAHDWYVGVDASMGMLREFQRRGAAASLVQADGRNLPFRDGSFNIVMLMQVLSGAGNGRAILTEARRVLRKKGTIVTGRTARPPEGMNAQLRDRLAEIFEEMNVEWHEPNKSRRQALAWLEDAASKHQQIRAATWKPQLTPRDFLARRRTAARFAALPPAVQQQALEKLEAWALKTFGSLDATLVEEHGLDLDVFTFD